MFYISKKEKIKSTIVIGIMFFGIVELQAYQPGKWSPMDIYVEQEIKGGPKSLELKNAEGKTLEISKFEYNSKGRLIEEKFYQPSGKFTGKIQYEYNLGNISSEVLLDSNGNVLSRKEFKIRPKSMEITVLDAKGETIMRHFIRHNKMKVTGGKEYNGDVTDQFVVSYDKGGRVQKLSFIRPGGSSITEINYSYDVNGKLISRTLRDDTVLSVCKYDYDEKGNIKSFTYYNGSDGKLIKDKTLIFDYSGFAQKSKDQKTLTGLK